MEDGIEIELRRQRIQQAAERAKREARARLQDYKAKTENPRELQGRGGLEPVRYNDWEIKGIAVDF